MFFVSNSINFHVTFIYEKRWSGSIACQTNGHHNLFRLTVWSFDNFSRGHASCLLWSRLYHFEDSKVPPTENSFHLEKQAFSIRGFLSNRSASLLARSVQRWRVTSLIRGVFIRLNCLYLLLFTKSLPKLLLNPIKDEISWGSYACPGHLLENIIDVNFWTTQFWLPNFKTS